MPESSYPPGEGDLRCRENSSHPFFQGLGPTPLEVPDTEAASSAQGTNTVVWGRQARHGVTPGRHHLAQSIFHPLVLPSFFPYWSHTGQGLAGWTLKPQPKARTSWTMASPP